MEQYCGPLTVEIIPGKHCDFSIYLTKREIAQSCACTEGKFPVYKQCSVPLAVEIVPGKHFDFSN
jgi:hypothetical protein